MPSLPLQMLAQGCHRLEIFRQSDVSSLTLYCRNRDTSARLYQLVGIHTHFLSVGMPCLSRMFPSDISKNAEMGNIIAVTSGIRSL